MSIALPPLHAVLTTISVAVKIILVPFGLFAPTADQGEANADQKMHGSTAPLTKYYSAYYQTMIKDWRERKGMGDFAFMTVQLPPSTPFFADPTKEMGTGRMEIRIAEAETAPHSGGLTDISGVAVVLDCGGKSAWGWDHPPNKNEISRRLALQTVHAAYAVQGRIPDAKPCADPVRFQIIRNART